MVDMSAVQGLPQMSDAEVARRGQALAQAAHPDGGPGLFGALSSSIHEMRSQFGGAAQTAGTALGMTGIADWGKDVAASQAEAAQAAGNADYAANPWSLGGAAYSILHAIPNIAGTIATGKLAAPVFRGMGFGAKAAETAGMAAFQYPLAVGSNAEIAKQSDNGNLSPENAAKAALLGIPVAAINSMMPKSLEGFAHGGMNGKLVSRFMQGAARTGVIGAGQGAAGTAISDMMDPTLTIAQRAQHVVDSTLQGAFQGAVLGGVTAGALGGKNTISTDAPDTTLTEAVDAAVAPKTTVGPADASGAAQVGLDLPEQRTPQMADQPPAPEMQGPTIPPELVDGRQMSLFTPDEEGARQADIFKMRGVVRDALGKAELDPNTDTSFADNLNATNTPELIKALREQVTRYDRDDDGKMPAWFKALAAAHGVVDETGKTRNLTDEHADLLTQIETQKGAVNGPYQTLLERAAQRKAEGNDARQTVLLDQANTLRARNDEKVAALRKRADELTPLMDQHAQADALPDKFSPKQVPDTLSDKPKAAALYQQMELLRDHSPDPKIAERAAWASDLLRSGREDKMRRAAQIAQDFADRVAREWGYSDRDKPVAPAVDEDAARRAADDITQPSPAPDTTVDEDAARRAADDITQPAPAPDTTVDEDAARRVAAEVPETPAEREAAVTAPPATPDAQPVVAAPEGIPFMVTKAMRKTLLERGYTVDDVRNMTPAKAQEALQAPPAPPAPPVTDNPTPSPEAQMKVRDEIAPTMLEAKRKELEDHVARTQADRATRLQAERQAALSQTGAYQPPKKSISLGGIQRSKDALATMAEPAGRTQADVDAEHLISNGATGAQVLKHIEDTTTDPNLRRLAKKMRERGLDPTISYGTRDEIEADAQATQGKAFDATNADAAYNETTNHVWLASRENTHQNIMHEMTHSATWKAIEAGGPIAKRMNDLFEQVKRSAAVRLDKAAGKVPYGLTNLHEFVAEAFTNPWFRDTLSKVTMPGETKTLWGKFKDAVKRLFNQPEKTRTALDEIMDMGQDLMDEHQKIDVSPQSEAIMAKRVADEHEKVGIVGAGIFHQAQDSLSKLVNLVSNPREMGTKISAFADYNMTRTQMIRRHAAEFASGATQHMEDAWAAHTAIGQAAATTGLHVKVAIDGIKDVATRDAALRDAFWSSQIGAHPFKTFAEQPNLHNRKDRAIIQPEIDRIAKAFNDVYRQKGARDAIAQAHAAGEAQNASQMMLGLHEFMRREKFGDLITDADVHDQFANNADAHTPVTAATFYRAALDKQVANIKQFVDAQEGSVAQLPQNDSARQAVTAQLKNLKGQLNAISSNLVTHEHSPYMPSGREGDYAAAFTLKLGDDGQIHPQALAALQDGLAARGLNVGINQHVDNPSVFIRVGTLDKAQQITDLAHELGKRGLLDEKGDAPLAKRLDDDAMASRTRPAWVKQMMDSVAQDTRIPEEQRAAIHDQLRQTWADILPSRDVVQLARKNVQGFSTDVARALDRRNSVWANGLANLVTQERKNVAFGEMRDDIGNLQRQPDVSKTVSAQNCLNELATREVGRDWRPQTTGGDTFRSALHAWQLGVSPAYFVLELSQAPMFVLPAMAAERGVAKSTAALTSNLAMTIKVMRAISSGPLGKYGVFTAQGLKDANIPPAIAEHLLKCNNRGWFENSATRELGMSADGRAQTATQKAIHWANLSALYTEVAMHVNTALAVKSLHDAKSFAEGLDAATDRIMEKGHWKWGAGENARSMGKQGFAGKATPYLTQFMGWQMKALETYYRELHTVFSGDASRDARIQSAKFIGGHMAAVVAFSGLSGLPTTPLMGMASKVMNTLTGSDQYDFEQNYRSYLTSMFGKEFGDAMARGLPHLAGFDMSDVGDEGLIPGGRFLADQRKWQDASKDAAWRSMGAGIGFASNAVSAMQDWSMGNPEAALRKLLPATLRNPYEAYMMNEHGYVNNSGVKAPIQPTSADVWKKALGLEPASMKQNEDLRDQAERTETMQHNISGAIEANIKRAISYRDGSSLQDAVQKAMAFNKTHPNTPIDVGRAAAGVQMENARAIGLGLPAGTGKPTDARLRTRLDPYYIPGKS
jgi:hypothetical protein